MKVIASLADSSIFPQVAAGIHSLSARDRIRRAEVNQWPIPRFKSYEECEQKIRA